MNKKLVILPLAIFGNLWIYQIISVNIFLAIILIFSVLTGVAVFNGHHKFLRPFAMLISTIVLFQISTTKIMPLVKSDGLTNDTQEKRMRLYPFSRLPIAYWLEKKPVTVSSYKILNNLSEVIDPNLYFFANHPRERVGVDEFEKFPYIMLLIFICGLIVAKKSQLLILSAGFLLAFILFSFIGSTNNLGPFLMFPFICLSIYLGLQKFINLKSSVITKAFIIGFFLVMLQIISYEIF